MDMRKCETLTFGEAMLHLNQCFNKPTFQKLHQAIMREIEDAKARPNSSSN